MRVDDFDYDLPPALIAQTPAEPRDSARLLTLDKATGALAHHTVRDLPALLHPGDVLVLNDTRVLPARVLAVKEGTGGQVEVLLLRRLDALRWRALVGGKRVRVGTRLALVGAPLGLVVEAEDDGPQRVIRFDAPAEPTLAQVGQAPLPPYIHTPLADAERYQTVYSHPHRAGSAAAPTAGLHLTTDLLLRLRERGISVARCTLHIGLDTFQPVRVDHVADHRIHSEWASLRADDAEVINRARLAGGRVIAVGTTSARTLETAALVSAGGDPTHPSAAPEACAWRPVAAFEADTALFITPGYRWRVVDGLLTNFHLPRSTLLMMVSALAGREAVLHAYAQARQHGYRFYSFGDAMFIA